MAYYKIYASLDGGADTVDEIAYLIGKYGFDFEEKGENKYEFKQSSDVFEWDELTSKLEKYYPEVYVGQVSDIGQVTQDVFGTKEQYEVLNLEM